MTRGFTFIEVLIIFALLCILSFVAIPDFRTTGEGIKMQQLVSDLNGFFILAKSEAMLQEQGVWIHLLSNKNPSLWVLVLSLTRIPPDPNRLLGHSLHVIEGRSYSDITLKTQWTSLQIKPSGKPSNAGSLSFYVDSKKQVKMIFHNVTGRFRVCGVGARHYAYPKC